MGWRTQLNDVWRAPQRPAAAAAVTLTVGVPLLRKAILSPRGGRDFRRRTLALATVWSVGAWAATPDTTISRRLREPKDPREVIVKATGVAGGLVGLFAVGAVIGSRISFMRSNIASVVDHARIGPVVPVVTLALATGAAEEAFFRGAAFDLAEEYHLPRVTTTTILHAVVTAATGNPMLVLASVPLSAAAATGRIRTGSALAPVVVHLIWSSGMLLMLPPLLAHTRPQV